MGVLRYLRSCAPTWGMALAAIVLASVLLFIAGVGRDVVLLASGIALAGLILGIAWGYLRKRAFYRELARCVAEPDVTRWLAEVVERPDFLEGELAYDALRSVAKVANDEVARQRRQGEEYREYIETWVHEAKSPLAAAHLMLENARASASAPAPFEKLDAVADELRRIEGYIDQALFYARSEAVERDYLIRRYNLSDLVTAAIKANAPALIEAHVAPVCRDLDHVVFTDEKWTGFILGQIIQNSVKYAREAGARIEFSGRLVDAGLATEAVELSIADNGCGVSEADLPRVFDKGFTGDNGRTGRKSTGIGLYLVRRLCDKMGVGVRAESVAGSGFTVTLSFSTNKFRYFD